MGTYEVKKYGDLFKYVIAYSTFERHQFQHRGKNRRQEEG
jgi:hypothetical protein